VNVRASARSRLREASNPVAITVMAISSPIRSSMTVPKMMFASGSAVARMISAASSTSNRLSVGPPVTLNSTP
jgi:hypothetical protein